MLEELVRVISNEQSESFDNVYVPYTERLLWRRNYLKQHYHTAQDIVLNAFANYHKEIGNYYYFREEQTTNELDSVIPAYATVTKRMVVYIRKKNIREKNDYDLRWFIQSDLKRRTCRFMSRDRSGRDVELDD